MKVVVPFVLVFCAFAVNAAAPSPRQALSLYEAAASALGHSASVRESIFDLQIAEIRAASAGALAKTSLGLTPYMDQTDVIEPLQLTPLGFRDSGLRGTLTQDLPTGTKLSLGVENSFENTRTSTLATERALSFGVSQALWRNAFGVADRASVKAQELNVNATRSRLDLRRAEICAQAASVFIRAHFAVLKAGLYEELYKSSQELRKAGQSARGRGLIGATDWLGVQADFLRMEGLSNRSATLAQEARRELEALVPGAFTKELLDPSTSISRIEPKMKELTEPRVGDEEAFYTRLQESLITEARAARSASDPDLDLKLEGRRTNGTYSGADYRDESIFVSLTLGMTFNDPSRRARAIELEYSAERAKARADEFRRNRLVSFQKSRESLMARQGQLKVEEERILLLERLVAESRQRFQSGRIEFQDYLRVRDQWLEARARLLELRDEYWRELLGFLIAERADAGLCAANGDKT